MSCSLFISQKIALILNDLKNKGELIYRNDVEIFCFDYHKARTAF